MASRAGPRRDFQRKRKGDPYLDRRSGEDRRQVYSIDFFLKGNSDRRYREERRNGRERRHECIRINEWSSICPDKNELSENQPYTVKLPRYRSTEK